MPDPVQAERCGSLDLRAYVTAETEQGLIARGLGIGDRVGPELQSDRNSYARPLSGAALGFASVRHANQYREIDGAPFIFHPVEVGQLLHREGQADDVIAAGLLHDVLEKTATTRRELEREFGWRVAMLVVTVSDDPRIPDYVERKRELRGRVAHSNPDAVAIYAADKISKLRELALLPSRRLETGRTRTELANLRASIDMLRRVAEDTALVGRLATEFAYLDATVRTTRSDTRVPRADP